MIARAFILAAAIVSAVAFPSMLRAQSISWELTPGPDEAYVQSLVIKPNGSIFASHYAGVHRSTDGGLTWQLARQGLSPKNNPLLAAAPIGDVYAAISGAGAFRSTDEGADWTQLPGLPLWTKCIAVSPAGSVFIGTWNGEVFHSTDRGSTWTQSIPDTNGAWISGFAFAGGSAFVATWGGGSVYRSTDNGSTWSPAGAGLNGARLYTLIADDSGKLFAGTYGEGGFRSTDLGASWQKITIAYDGSYVYSLAAKSSDELYAGLWSYGFYRSSDGGTTWTEGNMGLMSREVCTIAVHPDGSIYCGTTSGANRSIDGGNNWIACNAGLNTPGISGFAVAPSGEIWAGTQNRLFSGSADGAQWTLKYPESERIDVSAIACLSASEVLVGTSSDIQRTTDGGVSWSIIRPHGASHPIQTIFPLPGVILAGTYDSGAFRSTDRGMTWSYSGPAPLDLRAFAARGGSPLFAGAYNGGIFRSTDLGLTWSAVNSGIPPGADDVTSLAVDESGAILATIKSNGVYRSTDDGSSWSAVNNGLGYLTGTSLAVDDQGTYYYGCDDGVYVSADHGGNWIRASEGLYTVYVEFLAKAAGGKIATGTLGGVYLSKSGAAAPRIAHSPAALAFGTVFVGTSSTRSILLSNTGGALLTLSGYTLSGADAALFTIAQPGPASLAPGSGDSIVIRFSPLLAGSFSAFLDIATNDPLAPNYRIPLSGSGSPIDPISVYGRQEDFGKVLIDSVGSISLLISNIGNARLILSNFRIAGADAGEFSFDPPSATYADPGMSLQIKLYFRPKSSGQKAAQFLFDSNDPRDPNGAVSLSGNAVTSGVAENRNAPVLLLLRENYPNPFHSATTIEFATLRNARVQLKILDIFGREVATLLDADLPPGAHRARWNAAGFIPGVYFCFCRLASGSQALTRRLLLLR